MTRPGWDRRFARHLPCTLWTLTPMAIYMKRKTSKIVVRILELLSSIFHNASAAPLAWDVILAAFSAAFYVLLSLRCTSRIRPLIFAPAQSQVLSLFLFVDWEDGADGWKYLLSAAHACIFFCIQRPQIGCVSLFRHFWTSLNFKANKNKIKKRQGHQRVCTTGES